ncbi:endonuclease domain-containing protein [bacterium]|nr:endonuclease domain-containing protein [bacterium]
MEQNQNLKKYAQALRKNQTREEGLLWYCFLSRYPLRFRRQYIIGNFIVDFYCHKAGLVIELDGSQHYDPQKMEYDRKRTEYLEAQGLKVLRFTNTDIQQRFRGVCEAIDIAVKERTDTFASNCKG